MIKISIIMPVYNCEMYLLQSINSVWKQSLRDWELLCIDDGSTDNSLEILRSFSEKDARIKVHTQSNRGAGVARNQGLQFAKGEFVAFLDADDYYLDPDALEVMYDTCVKNKVAACGSYLHILRGEKAAQDILFAEIKKSGEKDTVYHYRDYQFDYGYYCFIYRTDVLKRSNIVFPHYRRFQDPPFFVQAMYAIDRFCFVDKALYCYRSPNVGLRFDSGKLSGLLSGILDNLIFSKEHQLQQLFDKTVKRLEWEYSDIICSNIEEKDVEILRLLLQINGVMEEVYGKEYVILPLQKLLGNAQEIKKEKREQFWKHLREKERIYIYGAGQMTHDFLMCLVQQGLYERVKGILVTDTTKNPKAMNGVSVKAFADYMYQTGDIVIVAVSGIYHEEIAGKFDMCGVKDYGLLSTAIFL